MGYHRAGFEVVGVDIKPQPHYPFTFIQADALEYLAQHGHAYAAHHSSPPCQRYSKMSVCRPGLADQYPDLIAPTRALLERTSKPYIIENVPGAPLRADVSLCGCQFSLRSPRGFGVRRRRVFESNIKIDTSVLRAHDHREPAMPITGHSPGRDWRRANPGVEAPRLAERREAMDVPWMNRDEVTEAIPPAFTEFIGKQLIAALERAA